MADQQGVIRKLAAILYADVAGYSRLTGADEEGTHRTVAAYLDALAERVSGHGGRVVHYAGDAVLADFSSVVAAVKCAVEVQNDVAARNTQIPDDQKVQFRIGVNLGDVIVDRDDIYGNGVNVAARLESLAEPGGICVSQQVLDEVQGKINARFDDMGPKTVKNISRPVHAFAVSLSVDEVPKPSPPSSQVDLSAPRQRAMIAILPFDNMSNDVDMDLLADGLVEDIIIGLERFHIVPVVSRTSSSRYRDNRPNARVIGNELGAAYLVEGSVRKAGNFVRIAAQAIDATTDEHLWSQRYDRPLDNSFDLQDEVSSGIIAALEPVLVDAELRKGRRAAPGFDKPSKTKLAAWHIYRFTKDDNAKAVHLLHEAIAENPNVAGRYHALTLVHMWDLTFGWSSDPGDSIRQAVATAEKADELEPNDAYKLATLAWSYAFSGECDRAIATVDRAIEIHPASAVPHGVKTWIAGHCGSPETAIKALEITLSRTTESPFIFQYLCGGALGHLARERWEKAAQLAESATVRRPNSLTGWVVQTVAHHNAGNEAEAARRFRKLIDLNPDMTKRWLEPFMPIKPPELKARMLATLCGIGLPEE